MERPEHPVAVNVELPVVRLGELAEGLGVARPGGVNELRLSLVGKSDCGLSHSAESKPPLIPGGAADVSGPLGQQSMNRRSEVGPGTGSCQGRPHSRVLTHTV